VAVSAFEQVKNVPQGTQFWNRRVIEISAVDHSDLFHDSPRTSVRLHSKCDHCVKVEVAKTKLQRCKRAFGGQSLTQKRGMRRYKSLTAGVNGTSGGTHFRPWEVEGHLELAAGCGRMTGKPEVC